MSKGKELERCSVCGAELRDGECLVCAETVVAGPAKLEAAANAVAKAGDIGERIGPFRLIEVIGEGGMGKVYRAEQEEPVRRPVALKVIKPGMNCEEVVARFEAERQALALMEHTGIATVYDAGTTEAGLPYFAMEMVEGVPLNQFCDDRNLDVAARLDLFVAVCRAVQHAHQKGIIHRDLKPTNILVADQDGKAVPKVIDFGIAKATEQPLTENTFFTMQGQMMGTPQYMSPEQTGLEGTDVDTRSDVYSLGIILYELLTGATPMDLREVRKGGYAELEKAIREGETPRPSTRLGRMGDTATAVAGLRDTDVGGLEKVLKGDLDWIVMKAVEKDRERRYDTVNGLAADVRRYLNNEEISARPPTFGYQAGKFAKRNKGVLTAAALVVAALVAGVVVSTVLAFRAIRAEKREALQRQVAELHTAAAVSQNVLRENPAEALRMAAEAARESVALLGEAPAPVLFSLAAALEGARELRRVSLSGSRCLAVAPGGEFIALGTSGAVITVNPRSGMTRPGRDGRPAGEVTAVAVSPDGRWIVSGSQDRKVRLLQADGQTTGAQWQAHGLAVKAVAFAPDSAGVWSAGADGSIRSWSLEGEERGVAVRCPGGGVTAIAFDPRGVFAVAAAGSILSTAVYRVELGNPEAPPMNLGGHVSQVSAIAFAPGGELFATGDLDGVIRVWNRAGRLKAGPFLHHRGRIFSLAFDREGRLLASASEDRTIRVVDLEGYAVQPAFALKDGNNRAEIAFLPNGEALVSVQQGKLHYWDLLGLQTGAPLLTGEPARQVAITRDGGRLACLTLSGALQIWDLERRELLRSVNAHGGITEGLALSPDGETLASCAETDTEVRFWTWEGEAAAFPVLRCGNEKVIGVDFFPDGERLAAVTAAGSLWMRDLAGKEEPVVVPLAEIDFRSGAIGRVACGEQFALAHVHSTGTGVETVGSGLVVCEETGAVRERLAGGEVNALLKATGLSGLAVAKRGGWMATGHTRGGFSLWPAGLLDAERVRTVRAENLMGIEAIAFAADGESVVAVSVGGRIVIVNVEGELVSPLIDGHQGRKVSGVAMAENGDFFATSGTDGTVRTWGFGVEAWLAMAEERLRGGEIIFGGKK